MAYIEIADRCDGCVFCVKPTHENDREELILHRGATCFVIMNLFPYNNGHVMIVPYRHTADLPGLSLDEQAEMMALTGHCVRALSETFRPEGLDRKSVV